MALLLLAAAGFGAWQTVNIRRARLAQRETIPEIERLQHTEQSLQAVRLARQVEPYATEDVARIRAAWFPFDTATDPAGAEVSVRDYVDEDGAWESLGTTPVRDHHLPLALYRLRVSKPGYLPMDVTYSVGRPTLEIGAGGGRSAGHDVRARRTGYSSASPGPCSLPTTGSTSTKSPIASSRSSSRPADTPTRSTGQSCRATAALQSRLNRRWIGCVTGPDAAGRRRGSSEVIPKARKTIPSAASAGSKPRPTPGLPASRCRRSITGGPRPAWTTSSPTSCG